ncbi:hypothetical protein BKA62DRAFT_35082 [Auriculariales sp. MPI-PUGE-AT-0066]|nr:hypothetical protein BKA62DRAFT_35082 [Auriculariales sp. MPI-PUGE-AT-0066]
MTSVKITTPGLLQQFYAHFPLHTLPAVPPPPSTAPHLSKSGPTLWIAPPSTDPPLSAEVDSLAAQALVTFHGTRVALRTDILPTGGIDGKLPTVQLEDGQLLGAHSVENWLGEAQDADEAKAWLALLESAIRPALLLHAPPPSLFDWTGYKFAASGAAWRLVLSPPPAPLTGIASPLPTFGARIDEASIKRKLTTSLHALAERLGRDTWFLGNSSPTNLDAHVFAFLHALSAYATLSYPTFPEHK